jgi:hypothetical protein
MQIDHRAFIFGTAALGITRAARADDAPVVVGVSGPLTGQYGADCSAVLTEIAATLTRPARRC